ncbi:MAG TPA: Ig domain-containing protein [Planctomycetota bacterium]|nr:Ig domain-containing protein [Planctomycetota bacterium]
MKMFHVNRWLRSAGLGLACACLGFTYALATSTDGAVGRGLSGRQISTNCQRPPARFVTEADLGDVVVGTHFTRQILVRFGFKPHLFVVGTVKPRSTFTIDESGALSGTKTDTEEESFEVRLSNSPDTRQLFRIRGVTSRQDNVALQFVSGSTLPRAVAGEPYTYTLHANGGAPPYIFQFKSRSDIRALPKGLSLNVETGEIFGKPVTPTTPVAFTMVATDSLGTSTERTFTLEVLSGTISSQFVATNGSFKLNFGAEGDADSVSLSMVLNKTELANAGIRRTEDLQGLEFSLGFGGATIPPVAATAEEGAPAQTSFPRTFDRGGNLKFPNLLLTGLPPARTETRRYEINLNPKTGVLRLRASGFNLIRLLGANFETFENPAIIPVSVRIGAAASTDDTPSPTVEGNNSTVQFNKTDIVRFSYRRRGNNGFGSARANDRLAPGGLFLITRVVGTEEKFNDPKTKTIYDRVVMRLTGYMRNINGGPVTFEATDNVQILLGNACIGTFPATSLKVEGDRLTFRNDDNTINLDINPNTGLPTDVEGAFIKNFVIDNKKGTVDFDIHPTPAGDIFGDDILEGGVPFVMPVTITISGGENDVSPSYDGQSSVTIFRRGNTLKNK